MHIVSTATCPSERRQVTDRVLLPPPHVSEHEPNDPSENAYVYDIVVVVVVVGEGAILAQSPLSKLHAALLHSGSQNPSPGHPAPHPDDAQDGAPVAQALSTATIIGRMI